MEHSCMARTEADETMAGHSAPVVVLLSDVGSIDVVRSAFRSYTYRGITCLKPYLCAMSVKQLKNLRGITTYLNFAGTQPDAAADFLSHLRRRETRLEDSIQIRITSQG